MSAFFSDLNAKRSSLKYTTVWPYLVNIYNPPYCKLLSCVRKDSRDDFPRKVYIALDYTKPKSIIMLYECYSCYSNGDGTAENCCTYMRQPEREAGYAVDCHEIYGHN